VSETSEDKTRAVSPDSMVALFPMPFVGLDDVMFVELHGETWMEEVEASWVIRDEPNDVGIYGEGHIVFKDEFGGDVVAEIVVEQPLPGMVQLASTSPEPFMETELVMLQQHRSIWRASISAEGKQARRAAKRMMQLFESMIQAGAHGVFLPGAMRLHAPLFVRRNTMDLFDAQALAKLFIGAFHVDEWMRTRGLTAFGLPELETKVDEGLNAAFFRLMDVAANMLYQMGPYPSGAQLQIGHQMFALEEGPAGPEDTDAPINGAFGVMTVARP